MPQRPDAYLAACPSRDVLAMLGNKWTALILARLGAGPLRFGALRREIDGVSPKMLAQRLRELERDGLVRRLVTATHVPIRVEYRLTPLGRSAMPLVRSSKRWAEKHLFAILAARARFDSSDAKKSRS